MGRRLSEFPQIKAFLGKGYLSKPVSSIVMGMSVGDVPKCIVRWKSASAASDRYVDLPMPKRKLNNLFNLNLNLIVDDNSAGLSSVSVVESCSSSSDDDEDADEDSASQQDEEGTGFGNVLVNGRKWDCMPPHLNIACPRKVAMHPRVKPSISISTDSQPIQYFESMFPNHLASSILQWTNATPLATGKAIRPSEFWAFVAIQLSMSVVKLPTINDYWNERDDGVFIAHKYRERFGMSRNRWKEIWSIMTFHDSTHQSHNDKFFKVRNLVNIFNDHMTNTFNAGRVHIMCGRNDADVVWFGGMAP